MKTNRLLATLAIISVVLISGCKKDTYQEVIGKCPIVVSTNPANGDTNVSIYKIITATFNEEMNPLTINDVSFTIQGSPAIAGSVTYADSTATFTPASPLQSNHKYTGTITTSVRDLSGNYLQKNYVWSFTTGANLPPTVIYTDPKNNDTGVVLNKIVTAIFSVPMISSSITAPATFTIKQTSTSTAIAGTVSYSNSTAIFTPTNKFTPGTSYTATITTGAKNLAGMAMVSNYVWTFTTGYLVAPTVIYTDPKNNDTGVVLNKIVTAIFSEPMNLSTITSPGTYTIKQTVTSAPVLGTVSYSGSTAIFTPTSNLLPGTNYTATITNAAKNLAGTSMVNNYVWTFTTQTPKSPIVVYTDPKNLDTGVVLNKIVTAIFSEPMNSSTITAVGTYTIKQTVTSAAVPGSVSYSGSTAIFTPTANLLPGIKYTATITTAAKNPAGTSMASNYVWTFTTLSLAKAPTVISTDPKNNDTGVVINKIITATFSEIMNPIPLTSPATTFNLKLGLVTIAGTVSYLGTTAYFDPTSDLLADTVYTATITTGAKNVAGTPLAADYVWTFRTKKAAGSVGPDLKTAARFGAFGGTAGVTNQGLFTVINNGGISTTGASTLITGFHDFLTADVYTETPLNVGEVKGGIYTAPPAPGTATSFAIAQAGLLDATAAYLSISPASMPGGIDPGAGELGALTLAPGVYKSASGSFNISNGDLTLDAQGDPNAVWVFQCATSLTVGIAGPTGARSVIMTNGGLAKNVYWYVGSSATINGAGGGIMTGNIIANSGVTFSTAGNVVLTVLNGRALSLISSVTMVNTVINVP